MLPCSQVCSHARRYALMLTACAPMAEAIRGQPPTGPCKWGQDRDAAGNCAGGSPIPASLSLSLCMILVCLHSLRSELPA
ncbi:unnamed protein product [Closterium sp. Naga37s-1]|nr:unnamed protein product [Closterium sp. Naga37s-1]